MFLKIYNILTNRRNKEWRDLLVSYMSLVRFLGRLLNILFPKKLFLISEFRDNLRGDRWHWWDRMAVALRSLVNQVSGPPSARVAASAGKLNVGG